MYYVIEQDQLKSVKKEQWMLHPQGICIFSSKEWERENDGKKEWLANTKGDAIRFCKLESHATYLLGTIHVPAKKDVGTTGFLAAGFEFAFYILKGKVIFVDDTGMVQALVQTLTEEKKRKGYSLPRCFHEFLVLLLEEDLVHLARIEREIGHIEETILGGNLDHLNVQMMCQKKEISKLYRYYSQLSDVGERLTDYESDFFEDEEGFSFKVFVDRVDRLQNETLILREYTMQVQDVYHSEIEIRQNDVMKVLTIVTTVFLPLTLIVGWYGMNFIHMPELGWRFGYPAVTALSVLVVLGCVWTFKRKKLW